MKRRVLALCAAVLMLVSASLPALAAGSDGGEVRTILCTHDRYDPVLPTPAEGGGEYGGFTTAAALLAQEGDNASGAVVTLDSGVTAEDETAPGESNAALGWRAVFWNLVELVKSPSWITLVVLLAAVVLIVVIVLAVRAIVRRRSRRRYGRGFRGNGMRAYRGRRRR